MFIERTENLRYTSQGGDNVYRLKLLIFCLMVPMLCQSAYAGTQLSQFGITWTFDKELTTDGAGNTYQHGQFANGDYWVIGPVTIIRIDPPSTETTATWCDNTGNTTSPHCWTGPRTMHGSMINPRAGVKTQGYDSENYCWHMRFGRIYPNDGAYDASLNVALDVGVSNPLVIGPNNSLVSTISVPWGELPQIKTAAILTVLPTAPAAGSFRPPYSGTDKTIKFNKNNLNYSLLSSLAPTASVPILHKAVLNNPDDQDETVERIFERPWLDHVSGPDARSIHPLATMENYGRDLSVQVGIGALMLHLNYTNSQKETLLIRYVQLGIDLYGIVEDGGDHNWPGNGGQASGRKFPILFAGLMLNDADMKGIGAMSGDYLDSGSYYAGNEPPDYVHFGEDDQTFYVEETSPGVYNYGYGGYNASHVGLPDYGIQHALIPSKDNSSWTANYRDCCTAVSWAGWVLAAQIMEEKASAKTLWNHDALFDYQDRYMDTEVEYRQWDSFTEDMWDAYRVDYPPVWPDTNTTSPQTSSITQYGVTWTFDTDYEYGQFANGDYWVVPNTPGGTVTITSITPTPTGGRNGFEINPMPGDKQPYDSRMEPGGSSYNPALQPALPVSVQPNSSVLSTISNPESINCTTSDMGYPGWLAYDGSKCSVSVLKTAAVLTVLDSAPPAGSFRPPYTGNNKPLYSSLTLHTDLLPSLPPVGGEPSLSELERRFERVWLDHIFGYESRGYHPSDNMINDYGAGIAVDTGEGALRLLLNDNLTDKQTLLIRYVQLGIDLYWMTQDGHYWRANGGHGSGRKLPILFAGLMLDEAGMKGIGSHNFPISNGFGEDCQTYYDGSGFPRWGIRHCWQPGLDDESNGYRSCCTSQSWVGQTLAARLLGLEELWNHQAYFDYVDRWMEENNDGDWGSAWSDLMWATYRESGPPQDTTPPSFTTGNVSKNSVEIVFTELVDEPSAENVNNYSITPGISINSATLDPASNIVALHTSEHIEDVTYTVIVSNVEDTAGNPMPETTVFYRYGGLVSHWKFDDGSGNTAADSSGGNTGTLVNGPVWSVNGRIDDGVRFDGSDDAIEVPTANWSADAGTIALWAKAEVFSSANNYFFGHAIQPWNNVIQLYAPNGSLTLGLGDSHTRRTNIQNLEVGSWYHIALTWNGTNYVVYVDGAEEATGTYTGLSTLETYADIGNNGNRAERNSEALNGIIDEVRLYNRALTQTEVLELLNPSLVFEPIGDKAVDEGSTLTFDVNTVDPNVIVDINEHNLPSDPCFFLNGGVWTFSWTPTYDDAGSYEVTFEARHGEYVDFETITITVINVNRQPLFTPAIGDKSVFEGNELRFTISAIDPDGDPITYSATNLPTGAVFSGDTFTWTPGYKQAGTYQVTFMGSDGQDQDSETITITVKNQNGPPTIAEIGDKSVSENSLLSFLLSATDPDDDLITYSCPNLPSGAVLSGETFAWTPTSGQTGVYEVTFVASDGQHQDSQTITISVVNFNIADPTLVGSWLFDDDPANGALDSSQYGNDGYAGLNGYPSLVPGKVGRAYSFDGVDDRVKVPHSPSLNVNKVTLSAWIYVNSYKNDQRIISKETGVKVRGSVYALLLSGKNEKRLQFRFALKGVKEGKKVTSNSRVPLNEWTHVAAAFNGRYVRLYINGALDKKALRSETVRPLRHNSKPVYIGDSQFYNRHFDGKIDDVRIYNKALRAARIRELYGQSN